jgi:hypothetical protein
MKYLIIAVLFFLVIVVSYTLIKFKAKRIYESGQPIPGYYGIFHILLCVLGIILIIIIAVLGVVLILTKFNII